MLVRFRKNTQILLFASAVLTARVALADGISVSQSLDRFSIPFEDSVRFEVVLKWNGPQSAYLFTKPLNPTFDRLKARGVTSSVSSSGSGSDEVTTKRFDYTLIPISSGLGSIDPVTISYISWPDSIPGELVTETMTVQIAEPLPPEKEHGGFTVWVLILVILVVVGSAAFAFVRWKKSRTPKEIEKTPVEQFLEDLTALKQESGSEFKKFQAGLYKLLVEFLTAKYAINPDGAADDEVEKLLEPTDLNEHQIKQISLWLVQARRDKFRPVVAAPGETIRLETEIRRFFEELKP
jgi:hypothetical protein